MDPDPDPAPAADQVPALAALSLRSSAADLPPDFDAEAAADADEEDDEGYATAASRGGSSTAASAAAWKAEEGLEEDGYGDAGPPSPSSSGYAGERGSSLASSGNGGDGIEEEEDEAPPLASGAEDWARGKKHADEDDGSASWRKRKKHFFILSNSGKPVYSRYGDEHKLAGFSATLQAIVSFVENSADHIKFVRAGKHQIVFLVKGPIYLVCISCTEESFEGLRGQLELMYGQMLLILTKSINRCFEKNTKFDMAPLLGGTDAVFLSLIRAFSWNPATFLHAYTCLPLAQATRQAANAVLQDIADSGVLFALLMCEHKVISLVGAQKATLHPDDILLLANFILSSESFRTSESFSPICLPRYNPMAFLYAYVHFFDENTYVVLLTPRSDAFYDLKDSRARIQDVLLKSNALLEVQRSLHENVLRVEDVPIDLPSQSTSPPAQSPEIAIGGPAGLWHFIYKSVYLDQYVSSEFASPIRNPKEQKRLYKAYQKFYASMHDKATGPHRTQFRRDEDYVLFCWITQDFELYAAFHPLADKTQAIKICNRVCQWIRDVESKDDGSASWRKRKKHFFILSNSGKPVYSRYGDEHKLAGFSATLQAIVSFVENSADHIKFVRAGKHQIVFLVKGPIYLVCISCTEESFEGLRGQLELMYGQMLLILTKSINRCFEKNTKFDMAPLLGGTDAVFLSLIRAFSWNPATFLHAYTCLPLAQATRQAASAVLQDIADSGVLFALLMCEHKVISLVGAQKATLHPDDILLLANFILSSESFRTSESFSPICLPRYNPMAFLYAYVHFFDENTYVVLLTPRSDAFYDLKDSRARIQDVLLKSNVLLEVQRSLHENVLRVEDVPIDLPSQSTSPPAESSEIAIGGPAGLWHFIYKSVYLDQYVSSEFASPIRNPKEQKRLYKAYQKFYASMHDKATGPHRTQFRRDEDYVLFCCVTQDFELYAAFHPLADKTQAIKICNRVCQWIRDVESKVFVYGESTLAW